MLSDTNVIDFVSTDSDENEVQLSISDELDWENELEHLLLMQKKLATYLAFIESGQLYEEYPQAKDKRLVIQVGAKYSIPDMGKEFYEKVKVTLGEAGYEFKYKVLL